VTAGVPRCPHCALPLELPIICDRCGWRWHANPYPAAGVLIEGQGADGEPSVLLLKRAIEPGLDQWDLPAGYLEPHESAEEGALREAQEEAGLEIELVRLSGVYSSKSGNAVTSVYVARPRDAQATVLLDSESSAFAWVPRSDVPAWVPRMAFQSMSQALSDWADGQFGVPHLD
jgi:ADP-ribose pyrophosphatase YjhB (NUDIX family)